MSLKRCSILLVPAMVLMGSMVGQAQPIEVVQSISVQDLRSRLEVIASDSMEGRETGMPGQKKAAAYLQQQLISFGIGPIDPIGGYQQAYTINVTYPDTVMLLMGRDTFKFLEDIYYFNLANMQLDVNEVTYMGYGIHTDAYSDYIGNDVKGKVLLVSSGEPRQGGNSLLDRTKVSTEWTTDWRKKITEAEQRGAKALMVIDDNFSTSVVQLRRYLNRPSMDVTGKQENSGIPVVFLSSRLANRILKQSRVKKGHVSLERTVERTGKTVSKALKVPMTLIVKRHREKLQAENVLGYIEGTDRKEELVVVSCHYDHLGMKDGEIYNGADDDGSGTSALLELAEAFALAKKMGQGPRRSVLFIAFSGEEKGLLGSEFYAEYPLFPLERTMVNLNIDMIGRIDQKHAPDSNYVYLIGSDKISMDLHQLNEQANATYTRLALDYTYNDENDPNRYYYRSDHYNFAKNGVPVIFYFTGVHVDYHKPTDTVEKIQFVKMKRIVDLIFHTAWELANRDKSIR